MNDFGLSSQFQNDNNDLSLSWDRTYKGPYSLYKSDSAAGPWSLVTTITVSSYLYKDISSNPSYFQVKSSQYRPHTNNVYSSNIIFVNPPHKEPRIALGEPYLILTDDPANGQIILSWPFVDQADFYSVYRKISSTGQTTFIGDTPNTSITDSTPYQTISDNNGPFYTYYVIPKSTTLYNAHEGPQSNKQNYILIGDNGDDPVLGSPYPPVFYQLFITSNSQPRLTWTVPDVLISGDVQILGPQIVGVYLNNYTSVPTGTIFYLHALRSSGNDSIAREVTDIVLQLPGTGSFKVLGNSENDGPVTFTNLHWEVNYVDLELVSPIKFYVNAISTTSSSSLSGANISSTMFGPTVFQKATGSLTSSLIVSGPSSGSSISSLNGIFSGSISGSIDGPITFDFFSGSVKGTSFISYTDYTGSQPFIPSSSLSRSFSGSISGRFGNATVVGDVRGSFTGASVISNITGSFSGSAVGLLSSTNNTGALATFWTNTVLDSQILSVTIS